MELREEKVNLGNFIKRIQDIMRNDSGINGDAQRLEQMVWLLFLKVYDAKEKEWEFMEDDYESIIPERLKWRNWAVDKKDGNVLTGEKLLEFINNDLFVTLKNIELTEQTTVKQSIVKAVFEDCNNYMKDGILLRQVVNVIDEINFTEYNERHAFGEIYETLLKTLQSAGNSGEFYTPRTITDFMVKMVKPTISDSVADFACGTGGFLTSTIKYLDKDIKSVEDRKFMDNLYGVEKKPLLYLLCITNMLLHDIDSPNIEHGNTLEKNVRDYTNKDKYDVILMNPPYGGSEKKEIQNNFPLELRGSETADLFMSVIMYRLKENGRAAVVLPDGFLFGTDNTKVNLKKKLLKEFNLHTIIRLPHSVFAPYTLITTNILFFDNLESSGETWFYRLDMPEGYKNFSKTKPMKIEHFNPVIEWWNNRQEIEEDGKFKAKKYTHTELEELGYDFDLCGFPHEEEEILEPKDLIINYKKKRKNLDEKIDSTLSQIFEILGFDVEEI